MSVSGPLSQPPTDRKAQTRGSRASTQGRLPASENQASGHQQLPSRRANLDCPLTPSVAAPRGRARVTLGTKATGKQSVCPSFPVFLSKLGAGRRRHPWPLTRSSTRLAHGPSPEFSHGARHHPTSTVRRCPAPDGLIISQKQCKCKTKFFGPTQRLEGLGSSRQTIEARLQTGEKTPLNHRPDAKSIGAGLVDTPSLGPAAAAPACFQTAPGRLPVRSGRGGTLGDRGGTCPVPKCLTGFFPDGSASVPWLSSAEHKGTQPTAKKSA